MPEKSPRADDEAFMGRAIALARQGEGAVEPNPMVGCLIAAGLEVVGEGWHQQFGGPHAEVNALAASGHRAKGATAYVSLEPCCHQGQTPPCTKALIDAGVARVVVATLDPNPQVAGGGVAALRAAGVEVVEGVCERQAQAVIAPFAKLMLEKRPWIIAKWAMTLDGKLATSRGDSKWISGELSRAIVHQIRGRVDAVMVGSGTAAADDPLLTARPPGVRTATRIVVDSQATLSPQSRLVQTANDVPVLIAVSSQAPREALEPLRDAGCEVLELPGATHRERLEQLLDELGRRRFTNVLAEGGGRFLGSLLDAGEVDEVHVFIAPKMMGGDNAPSPWRGTGVSNVTQALSIDPHFERVGSDLYLRGRVRNA